MITDIKLTNEGYEYILAAPVPKYGYFVYLDGVYIKTVNATKFVDPELKPYEVVGGGTATPSHIAGKRIRLQWTSVDGATHYLIKARYGEGETHTIAVVPHQGVYNEFQAEDIDADTDVLYSIAPAVKIDEHVAPIAEPIELFAQRLVIPPPPEVLSFEITGGTVLI